MSETDAGDVFAEPGALRDAVLASACPRTRWRRPRPTGCSSCWRSNTRWSPRSRRSGSRRSPPAPGSRPARSARSGGPSASPIPRPAERVFTETDVEMLSAVVEFIREGALESGLALQMSRVIGSSMERVATALVDAIDSQLYGPPRLRRRPGGKLDLVEAGEVLPLMPHIMDMVWRRHLGGAARRRIVRAGADEGEIVCVGFADLVGFTSATQELPDQQLAEVVGRFETHRLRPHRVALGSRRQDDRRRGHVHDRRRAVGRRAGHRHGGHVPRGRGAVRRPRRHGQRPSARA